MLEFIERSKAERRKRRSMVSEAAVKPRPRTGQATGSQVRYREVMAYAIPQNGFYLFPALVRLDAGLHRISYVSQQFRRRVGVSSAPQASATASDSILPGEPCDRFHDLAETLEKQIPKKTRVKVYSCACKISYPMDATLVEHQMTLSHRHRKVLAEALIEGRKHYRQIS